MVHRQHDGSIEFAFFRPGAVSVAIAGTFNQWQIHTHFLSKDENGWWRIRMQLPIGKHEFKYVVDGNLWEADFAAYGLEMCDIGGWNSVVWVDRIATEQELSSAA